MAKDLYHEQVKRGLLMETITSYKKIIIELLEEYTRHHYVNAPHLEQQVIADTERNHYQLIDIGWDQGRFVLDVSIHLDLVDQKIHIRQNWTDIKLKQTLVDRGVNPADIVVESVVAPILVIS